MLKKTIPCFNFFHFQINIDSIRKTKITKDNEKITIFNYYQMLFTCIDNSTDMLYRTGQIAGQHVSRSAGKQVRMISLPL